MESLRFRRTALLGKLRAGFTLVEMLVVLAIITVIMAVVFTGQGAFNRSLVLANTAYDIALFIRSTESYGITTHVIGSDANAGYGVDFTSSPADRFTLFHDVVPSTPSGVCHALPVIGGTSNPNAPSAKPGNCLYDTDEMVKQYQIQNGITVSDLCTYSFTGGSPPTGWNPGWTCSRSRIDITFARPNPQPVIRYNNSNSNPAAAACIVLVAPQSGPNDKRYVSVVASGSVSVLAKPCP